MRMPNAEKDCISFDPQSGELWAGGVRRQLQNQPARLLALFVARAGEVVSRQEIRQALWGDATHVDYDEGINYAVQQIRRALGDPATAPRYLATLPRRGYRWLAGPLPVPTAPPAEDVGQTAAVTIRSPQRRASRLLLWASGLLLGLPLLLLLVGWRPGLPPVSTTDRASVDDSDPLFSPDALPALDAYARGVTWSSRVETLPEALTALSEASALAPRSALTQAGLARGLLLAQLAGTRPDGGTVAVGQLDGRSLAERAVRLAPGSPVGWLALAESRMWQGYDWSGAEAALARAMALDPRRADTLAVAAMLAAARGDASAALVAADRALALAPGCLTHRSDGAWYALFAGQPQGAIARAEGLLRLSPSDAGAYRLLILAYQALGDASAAAAAASRHLAALSGDRPAPAALDLASYWQGSLATVRQQAAGQPVAATELALLELATGQPAGLERLQAACRQHEGRELAWLAIDTRVASWRGDPRYHVVRACLRLPASPV